MYPGNPGGGSLPPVGWQPQFSLQTMITHFFPGTYSFPKVLKNKGEKKREGGSRKNNKKK